MSVFEHGLKKDREDRPLPLSRIVVSYARRLFGFHAKTQRKTKAQRRVKFLCLSLCLCAPSVPLCEIFLQLPGVRGLALSPDAPLGSGGKLSPSFNCTPIGVAACRFPSSNRLNSASSRSASSCFFNREYARKS